MSYSANTVDAVTRILMSVLEDKEDAAATPSIAKAVNCPAIYESIDEAVQAAFEAQKVLARMSLAQKNDIITNIRRVFRGHIEELARMELEETGFGRLEDKIAKYHLTLDKTPGIEDIQPEVFSGDHGLTVVERRPYGVAGCILPSTAPVCTAVHNAICMIAAGNSAVMDVCLLPPSAGNMPDWTAEGDNTIWRIAIPPTEPS